MTDVPGVGLSAEEVLATLRALQATDVPAHGGRTLAYVYDSGLADADAVVGMIRGFKPGDRVTITYVRDDQTQTATVTLAERTAD